MSSASLALARPWLLTARQLQLGGIEIERRQLGRQEAVLAFGHVERQLVTVQLERRRQFRSRIDGGESGHIPFFSFAAGRQGDHFLLPNAGRDDLPRRQRIDELNALAFLVHQCRIVPQSARTIEVAAGAMNDNEQIDRPLPAAWEIDFHFPAAIELFQVAKAEELERRGLFWFLSARRPRQRDDQKGRDCKNSHSEPLRDDHGRCRSWPPKTSRYQD